MDIESIKRRIATERSLALASCTTVSTEQLKDVLQQAAADNRCLVSLTVMAEETGVRKRADIIVAAKVSTIDGVIQRKTGMYERAVNNQRDKEGLEEPFEASTPNYEWIDGGPFATMRDKLCVPMKAQGGGSVYYDEHGQPLDYETVKPHLLAKSSPKNQGTDNPVQWRAPYLKNIIAARVNGQHYVVHSQAGDAEFRGEQQKPEKSADAPVSPDQEALQPALA